MHKQRLLTLSFLLACSLSLPALAADGPEPMTYDGQNPTNQVIQAESDRSTLHLHEAGLDTGLQNQTPNSGSDELNSDANDPDDPDAPDKAAAGGNFWIMMPLLLFGSIALFFMYRRPDTGKV